MQPEYINYKGEFKRSKEEAEKRKESFRINSGRLRYSATISAWKRIIPIAATVIIVLAIIIIPTAVLVSKPEEPGIVFYLFYFSQLS